MSSRKHILILDPIPFAGGSKVATKHILQQLDGNATHISILTADPQSWAKSDARITRLRMPKKLERTEQGIAYFLRHGLIALQVLWLRLIIGKVDVALAASGPGVDLGLYLARLFAGFDIVQMIHGPVACSRTIGRCLLDADKVFYLDSTRDSLNRALEAAGSALDADEFSHFKTFRNGLPRETWPSQCQYESAAVFWAASLLKWKGLDVLTEALGRLTPSERPQTHVCYIRPKQTNLAVSDAPQPINKVFWHQEPDNLDAIRSGCNIFVSTSTKEPFGLSILEAMAAGMCVLIPADGAYWDNQLTNGENCFKYQADNADDLRRVLNLAQSDMRKVKQLGTAASVLAQQYRAEHCFSAICNALTQTAGGSLRSLTSDEVQG